MIDFDSDPIGVLVADDHPITRAGLCFFIERATNLELVAQAENGIDAANWAIGLKPDVTLLDLFMPGKHGLEVIREIRQADQTARILVLTGFGDGALVREAIEAGAQGYLLKDTPLHVLYQAIQDVYQGKSSLDANVAHQVMQMVKEPPDSSPPLLSERELEVLCLLGRGLGCEEIAQALSLSPRTIDKHTGNILTKLKLKNRTQAALYALQQGYVDLDGNRLI